MNRIANFQDFLGINFYNRNKMLFWKIKNDNKKRSDMGWELYPQGLYNATQKMYSRYKKPIYITETGLADSHDQDREWYIKKNIEAMSRALKEGIDIKGYLHWSLLDNFEWDKGFWPRFGLIEVDFKTQKRKVRQSTKKYSEIIKRQKSLSTE
ncbi:family 1 glycosylhydrolase [Candidatus Nomurabacteria bacterium]|nr:family 1 glycosylhydrolase [Candidatus Nomurabacteria bacterium]